MRPSLERLEGRELLSAGDLDPTFGVGGQVTTHFEGSLPDTVGAVVRQPDNKVVLLGTVADGVGLVRLEADTVEHYDVRLRDDASGTTLTLDTVKGAYRLDRCGRPTVTGRGAVETRSSCNVRFSAAGDVTIEAKVNLCRRKGRATIRDADGTTIFFKDRLAVDDPAGCP